MCQSLSTVSVGGISIPRSFVGERCSSSALGSGSRWADGAGDGVYWCCWDDVDGRDALGAEGVLPSRQIESFLRVFKQFAHTLPSRQVVG